MIIISDSKLSQQTSTAAETLPLMILTTHAEDSDSSEKCCKTVAKVSHVIKWLNDHILLLHWQVWVSKVLSPVFYWIWRHRYLFYVTSTFQTLQCLFKIKGRKFPPSHFVQILCTFQFNNINELRCAFDLYDMEICKYTFANTQYITCCNILYVSSCH